MLDVLTMVIILIMSLLAALFMSFNIGANVATTMGATLGCKALKLWQIILLAGFFELSGAILLGSFVSKTVSTGLLTIPPPYNDFITKEYMLAMFSTLLGSSLWLIFATILSLPVSTSHSVIGSVIFIGICINGFESVDYFNLLKIISSWVLSPLIGGIVSFCSWYILKNYVVETGITDQFKQLKRILISFPIIVSLTVGILILFILYKGLSVFHLQISFFTASIGASFISLLVGFASILWIGPILRNKINEQYDQYERTINNKKYKALKMIDENYNNQLNISKKNADKLEKSIQQMEMMQQQNQNDLSSSLNKKKSKSIKKKLQNKNDDEKNKIKEVIVKNLNENDNDNDNNDNNNDNNTKQDKNSTPVLRENDDDEFSIHSNDDDIDLHSIVDDDNDNEIDVIEEDEIQSGSDNDNDNDNNNNENKNNDINNNISNNNISNNNITNNDDEDEKTFNTLSVSTSINNMQNEIQNCLKNNEINDNINNSDENDELNEEFKNNFNNNNNNGDNEEEDEDDNKIDIPENNIFSGIAENKNKNKKKSLIKRLKQIQKNRKLRKLQNKKTDEEICSILEKKRRIAEKYTFNILVIITGCTIAAAHGSNDIGNAAGPLGGIALAYLIKSVPNSSTTVDIPIWVSLVSSSALIFGLAILGYRLMKTIGENITPLSPARAFVVQLSSSFVTLSASLLGLPLSTTHIIVGSVFGISIVDMKRLIDLNFSVFIKIILSWVVTIPLAGLLCVACFYSLRWLL